MCPMQYIIADKYLTAINLNSLLKTLPHTYFSLVKVKSKILFIVINRISLMKTLSTIWEQWWLIEQLEMLFGTENDQLMRLAELKGTL